MNRTVLTTENIRDLIKNAFTNNDEEVKYIENNQEKTSSIMEFLNLNFYSFKCNIMKDEQDKRVEVKPNKSFALVEVLDEEATISPDIDFVEKSGTITFIIQESKIELLDYYVQKLRNIYLGKPEKIENNFGETLNTYLLFGILQYDNEPEDDQFGTSIKCSMGFKLTYLTNALTYSDYEMSICLDNEFLHVPISELSMQIIFANDSLPKYKRTDAAGIINKTSTFVLSFNFYDFLKPLSKKLTDKFMAFAAYKKNNEEIPIQDINEALIVKLKICDDECLLNCVIDNMQKKVENGSYSNTAMTLKGRAEDVI